MNYLNRIKKTFSVIISISISIMLSSCSVMEEMTESTTDKGTRSAAREVRDPYMTKSGVQVDSLQMLIAFQTSQRVLLLHQIRRSSGSYVLKITNDDTRELGIPDSLYNWAIDYVNGLNNHQDIDSD